ncbi:MAG TPA: hypothetical protein VGR28_09305 [Candidatus Thermoplasmatota archaeon]|nr:hypothetical protein [Candidatus Thermoplasmatota archaeon]
MLLLPGASALITFGSAPCPAPDFIAGTQLVAAPGGQYAKVTFQVAAPLTDTFWAETGLRVSSLNGLTNGAYGYFAERALTVAFFEDLAGNAIAPPSGVLMYPYGIQLDSDVLSFRVAEGDAGCGGAAAGMPLTLAPGTYVGIALGASETNSEVALVLPASVEVLGIQYGATQRASEAEFDCQARVRGEAAGFSSEALVGCATTFTAASKAYRAMSVGHFPDAAHTVTWTEPDGFTTKPLVFFDLGTGAAGDWRLNIPRYATPLGQPFFVPIPGPQVLGADSGVFGVFADIP